MAPDNAIPPIEEPGAFRIVAEAVQALRLASAGTLAAYYAGVIPFVVALLYFWADLSNGLVARTSCADAALVLAALFLWMKFWQTVYCARLRAQLLGRADERWTLGRTLRTLISQTLVQTVGLFVLPLALASLLFFQVAYYFFQNATVLGGAPAREAEGLTKRAWRQAHRWQRQGWVLLWGLSPWVTVASVVVAVGLAALSRFQFDPEFAGMFLLLPLVLLPVLLSPVGLALAINLTLALAAGPFLLSAFFGVQTTFALSGEAAIFNTTFLATVCAMVFLCLDPVMKAACVLRCHYGESLVTGEDLMAEIGDIRTDAASDRRTWHSGAATVALLVLLLSGTQVAKGADGVAESRTGVSPVSTTQGANSSETGGTPVLLSATVEPASLDHAITEVLAERRYQWRLPPDEAEKAALQAQDKDDGWFLRFVESIGSTMDRWSKKLQDWNHRFAKWLRHLLGLDKKKEREPVRLDRSASLLEIPILYLVLYSLLAAVLAVLVIIVLRQVRARKRAVQVQAQPVAVATAPDLESEDVRADRLPTDEWVALARELAARGEYRLAMRALFLSGLAWLAARDLLRIAKAKSNHEYERELRRRAHSWPEVVESFAGNARDFDAVWYGDRPADASLLAAFEQRLEGMRRHAE